VKDSAFDELVEVVSSLRDPENGCPWDLEQTHESLAKYLREESDEVLEVLGNFDGSKATDADKKHLQEELGDVLLQVLLHSQIAKEEGVFTIEDVVSGLKDKLIRRHPHVFGDSDAKTVEEVKKQWEQIKAAEKDNNDD
jgi:tetrapyrrole methylase family protein/MazG family protein